MRKEATSVRLSAEGKHALATLAATLGISQAAVIEMAVRHLSAHETVRGEQTREGDSEHVR